MKGLAVLRSLAAALAVAFGAAACAGMSSTPAPVGGTLGPQAHSVNAGGLTPLGAARGPLLKPAATCPNPVQFNAPAEPAPCTIYVGGFISPTHFETPSQQIASEALFEQQIGRKMAMALHYYQWTDGWPGILEQDDAKNGRIPIVSWRCGTTDSSIVAGNWDQLITARAQAAAAYGRTIFVRYKWEMNLLYRTKNPFPCADPVNDYPIPKNGHRLQYNPQYYIWAWEHIREIFFVNGATNVVWLFNPSSNGVDPSLYYPGDSQVDWVGFDHYGTPQDSSFYDIFTQGGTSHGPRTVRTYNYLVKKFPNKPLMIGETGVGYVNPANQQQIFLGGDPSKNLPQGASADYALQNYFPHIQAVLYWDSRGQRGNYQLQQFGIQSFAQFASGPYEQAY